MIRGYSQGGDGASFDGCNIQLVESHVYRKCKRTLCSGTDDRLQILLIVENKNNALGCP